MNNVSSSQKIICVGFFFLIFSLVKLMTYEKNKLHKKKILHAFCGYDTEKGTDFIFKKNNI